MFYNLKNIESIFIVFGTHSYLLNACIISHFTLCFYSTRELGHSVSIQQMPPAWLPHNLMQFSENDRQESMQNAKFQRL